MDILELIRKMLRKSSEETMFYPEGFVGHLKLQSNEWRRNLS